jgi:hypothetical protein
MVRPDLGQFLQAAYRQLADAERAMPPSGARLDEAAGQLARLTAVLPPIPGDHQRLLDQTALE